MLAPVFLGHLLSGRNQVSSRVRRLFRVAKTKRDSVRVCHLPSKRNPVELSFGRVLLLFLLSNILGARRAIAFDFQGRDVLSSNTLRSNLARQPACCRCSVLSSKIWCGGKYRGTPRPPWVTLSCCAQQECLFTTSALLVRLLYFAERCNSVLLYSTCFSTVWCVICKRS